MVMRRPVVVGLGVLVSVVTLGSSFLHVSFSTPDVKVLPANQEARVVSDRLSQDFAQQGNAQLVIAVRTPGDALSATNLANLAAYVREIKAIPGTVSVDSLVSVNPSLSLADYQQLYAHSGVNPELSAVAAQLAHGDATKITVAIQPADHTVAAEDMVREVRAIHAPGGLVPLVDGTTAYQIDLLARWGSPLPSPFLLILIPLSLLLFFITPSLLI